MKSGQKLEYMIRKLHMVMCLPYWPCFVVESGQWGGETEGSSLLCSVFSFNIEPGSLCTKTSVKGSRGWTSPTRYYVHKFGHNCRISKGSTGLAVPFHTPPRWSWLLRFFVTWWMGQMHFFARSNQTLKIN